MKSQKHPIKYDFQQQGQSGAKIYGNNQLIAEIRDLYLCNVRFQPDGPVLIGSTMPMPLFWWQYANHEDPERRAGANAEITLIELTNDHIVFACISTNQSGSIISRYDVDLSFREDLNSYVFHIQAHLLISKGKSWIVTPNITHGEVEFCNLWPEMSFVTDNVVRKRFQACYVQRGDEIVRIPHHHLETSDKQDIPLDQHDRFMWLTEDVNPVVEMVSNHPVHAGVCAYMWDAHFGYSVCKDQQEKILEGGTEFNAEFRIYAMNRKMGKVIADSASDAVVPEIDDIPVYVNGINTFSQTITDFPGSADRVWPWVFEAVDDVHGQALGTVDHTQGYDDQNSLKIKHAASGRSQWIATTLGPAYGQEPFRDGARFKLRAYVKTEDLTGAADIAIRLHREGQGSVFQLSDYEVFPAQNSLKGTNDWQLLEITTPSISPAPDRVHLLLRQAGQGRSWFDNVLFEIKDVD